MYVFGRFLGLQYVLMKRAYTDAYILHDETTDDPKLRDDIKAMEAHFGSRFLRHEGDQVPPDIDLDQKDNRQQLSKLWAKVISPLPRLPLPKSFLLHVICFSRLEMVQVSTNLDDPELFWRENCVVFRLEWDTCVVSCFTNYSRLRNLYLWFS